MKKHFLLSMVLSGWLCMSCESLNHEENNSTFMNEQVSVNTISEQEAISNALQFLDDQSTVTKSQTDSLIPEVQTIFRPISIQGQQQVAYSISNEGYENIPVYIINFKTITGEKKGFVVEVGDKRVLGKVLAFSSIGMWDMSNLPEFEHIFFEQTDKLISKSINEYQTNFSSDVAPCDTGLFQEITKTTTKKCAMNLNWGQSPSPYNDSLPICVSTLQKDPAGCVAVAIAQIMAHHQKPTSGSYIHPVNMKLRNTTYNWSGMKSVADAKNLTNTTGHK